MKLPNFEFAIIEDEKLKGYCLNPDHPIGKHKAKLFEKRLNINQDQSKLLKKWIIAGISSAECFESAPSDFGRRFTVDIILVNFEKEAKVRTSWIIRNTELLLRLTSCYIIED